MNAVIYARVSTERQDLEQQEQKLWEYVTDDLEIPTKDISVLRDESTGRNTDRSGYRQLMQTVENAEVDIVICRSISRIGRNMRNIYDTVYTIVEDHSVGLHAINDGFEVDSGAKMSQSDKAYLNALSLAAELEADMIQQRVIDGLRAAEAAGKWTTRPPYGFTTDDDGYLQPSEEYRNAVEAITAVEQMGWSHRKASRHTGVPRRTVPSILSRKEMYLDEYRDDDTVEDAREDLVTNGGAGDAE